MFNIAKVVGKPIRVDYAIGEVSKGRYTLVCVELNIDDKVTFKVWVGGE